MVAQIGSVWTVKLSAAQRKYLSAILALATIVAPEQRSLHRRETTLRTALLVGLRAIAHELEARAKKQPTFRRG